jgi:hypothetical protein
MEFALVLRELWGRKRTLLCGLLLAIVAATLSVYRLDGFNLKPRGIEYSAASTQVLVDSTSSVLGNSSQIFDGPDARATVFANFMTSPAVLDLIGQKAGIPGNQIYAAGPVNPNVARVVQEPTAGKRNVQVTGETDPFRLNLNADPTLPIISIYSQAPTTAQAIALANGAVTGLQEYLTQVEDTDNIRESNRVVVHPLGAATGGVVDPGIRKSLAGMVFIAVSVLWCVLMLVGARFRQNWKASAAVYDAGDVARREVGSPEADDVVSPQPAPEPVSVAAPEDGRPIPADDYLTADEDAYASVQPDPQLEDDAEVEDPEFVASARGWDHRNGAHHQWTRHPAGRKSR